MKDSNQEMEQKEKLQETKRCAIYELTEPEINSIEGVIEIINREEYISLEGDIEFNPNDFFTLRGRFNRSLIKKLELRYYMTHGKLFEGNLLEVVSERIITERVPFTEYWSMFQMSPAIFYQLYNGMQYLQIGKFEKQVHRDFKYYLNPEHVGYNLKAGRILRLFINSLKVGLEDE